ncbi:MAG: CHASE2 domain-containing protein [Cyanobacteria bacterium P01_A01_bin.17]
MYQVILSFGKGTLAEGFANVNVQLFDPQQQPMMRDSCSLPAAPELMALHQLWQSQYQAHYQNLGWSTRIDIHEPTAVSSHFSRREFDLHCTQLPVLLNRWLRHESFVAIEQTLRTYLSFHHQIQLILETDDQDLKLLPWHSWQFVIDYAQADVALSLPRSRPPLQHLAPRKKSVKILAVLGSPVLGVHDRKIDVATDRAFIEQLAHVDATFLVEPSRAELTQSLWEQHWDILFFAGHSTHVDGQIALLLNQDAEQNSLTINEFHHALNHAVEQGLQLAIFNSCDSLGLAWTLAELNIPQTIAFRDAVPDPVAHAFLKHFLAAFAAGVPTPQAVRTAREQLQEFERHCPCASWLPIICQNPTVLPLTWSDLQGQPSELRSSQKVAFWVPVVMSLLATGVLLLTRTQGHLQELELQAFDHLMQGRPAESLDDRFLIVAIDEADLQDQRQRGMRPVGYLADQALEQLLVKLQNYEPALVGLDIYHDFEFEPALGALVKNNARFIAACEIAQTEQRPHTIIGPPGIPNQRLGFTDLPEDPGRMIRRQLLYMDPVRGCDTEQSLSLRIASQYLQQFGESTPQLSSKQVLRIGDVQFTPLSSDAGGYQLPSGEAGGYQVMLNYRAAQFPMVHLRDLLGEGLNTQLANLIPGRIILIGVVQSGVDAHPTAFGTRKANGEQAGVIVQAHMISQILSAVEQGRPLIWWWPQGVEYLWIGTWSLLGSLLVWRWSSTVVRSASLTVAAGVLIGSCMGVLLIGGWIPLVPAMMGLLISGGAVMVYTNVKVTHVSQPPILGGRDA